MIRITQFFALIALTLTFGAAPALAQTTAKLIADVNVTSHTLIITNGTVSGSFSAVSDMGNQEARYGFVLRSKEGVILGASEPLGTLSLVEKVPQTQQVSYKLPSVEEDANVYLNLSNDAGIVLALVPVGTVPAADTARICAVENSSVSCTADTASTLVVTVYEGGAQGAVAHTQTFTLAAGKKTAVSFADLLDAEQGGIYLISGSVTEEEKETERFAVEYVKRGARAKIGSVSISSSPENGSFKATVYTMIFSQTATTSFTLGLVTEGCGDVQQTPVSKDNVTEMQFPTSCSSGSATVTLYQNGTPVDTATVGFSTPPSVKTTTMNTTTYAIIGIVGLLSALLVFHARRKEEESVPQGGSSVAPSAAPSTVAVAIALAVTAMLVPAQADAATLSGSASAEFIFCPSGSCSDYSEPSGTMFVSGTVTYPSSVNANSSYTISVVQQNDTVGTVSAHGGCRDTSGDTYDCDVYDVRSYGSSGGTSYSFAHVTSGSQTFTAPSSGSITFNATIAPYAPNYLGCKPEWLSPSVKCSMSLYPASSGNISIPVNAATPTVDVNFSFLEKMFKVFALAN